MGYGCYYTNKETGTKAFWIYLDYYYIDEETGKEIYDEFLWDNVIENLTYELENIGYNNDDDYKFSNGLYNLILESGHGGEIVFRLEPKGEEQYYADDVRIYNFAIANHNKCYKYLAKQLLTI